MHLQGKGVPDVNTRLMIRKIWSALNIPVFGLVDADPHGMIIVNLKNFKEKNYVVVVCVTYGTLSLHTQIRTDSFI